jgi:NAD+ synthase (glutamine-hydrolysing)
MAEVRKALVYMLSENLKRWGIERVVIGASGGIDSAVSAVLYTEALGADRVFLVNMPTRFNSKTTRNAAKDLADNLGCPYLEAPITDTIDVFCRGLSSLSFERSSASLKVEGIHYENLQARTRSATFLATIASVLNAAFTCNGNKSEVMTGYCTLYGDTCGIVCALGDLWKTQVYELAREMNKEREIIPETSILIPASAELSDAQNVDEGKGDPIVYAYHDKLFSFWMERWNRNSLEDSIEALKDGSLYEKLSISKDFFDSLFKSYEDAIADMKYWWERYKGIALAKRIQMPPVLCVACRAFGSDLRESQI